MASNLRFGAFDPKKQSQERDTVPSMERRRAADEISGLRARAFAADAVKSLPAAKSIDQMLAKVVPSPTLQRTSMSAGALPPMEGVTGGASSTAIPEDISDQPSDRERFPGLSGAMPARFTPAQTAQTLSALKTNARPYLMTDDRERGPFSLERTKEGAAGGEFEFRGGGQTRGESDWERGSMDRQVAFSQGQDMTRQGGEVGALLRAKQIADAQAALGFTQKYGVPYDPQTAQQVRESERQAAMDADFSRAVNSVYARLMTGDYDEADARQAISDLARQWGVRKSAPEGYFRSLQPQGVEALLGAQ